METAASRTKETAVVVTIVDFRLINSIFDCVSGVDKLFQPSFQPAH